MHVHEENRRRRRRDEGEGENEKEDEEKEGRSGMGGTRTVLHEQVLVVDDRDVLLREVLDLPTLDLPKLLRDLRDETYAHDRLAIGE